MRLRNVKNKKEILSNSNYIIENPKEHIGKWRKVFTNNNPIYIEIGMGKGKFIIENAINNPNINYIGIEKSDSILSIAVKRMEKDISNLKLIRLDATNIDEVFDKEISLLYLNFSDPWPKERHSKRRLTSNIFLDKYNKIFKENKIICQKTDNQNLFEYSVESLTRHGYQIEKISLDLHNSELKDNIMTEYEERFVKENKIIYYLLAKK